MEKMDHANKLIRVFSRARINAYCKVMDSHNLAAHTFNILLSEAFYPLLQLVELGLRNNIDSAFKEFFGLNWLDQSFIAKREQEQICQIRVDLRKRKCFVSHDKMIAELNYGFWTALLKPDYEVIVWRRIIKEVFPYVPRKVCNRKFIYNRFNEIRLLRNRIFHHEKISIDNVLDQHSKIHEAIKWLSAALYDVAQRVDRFPALYRDKEKILFDLCAFHGEQNLEVELPQYELAD